MKLTEEQSREILDLVESDAFKVLAQTVLPQLIQRHVDRLMSVDFSKSANELVIERARLDGASKLAADIKGLKDHFRKASTGSRKNA